MKTILLALLVLVAAGVTAPAYVLPIQFAYERRAFGIFSPRHSVPTNSLNRTTHAIRYYLASTGIRRRTRRRNWNCIALRSASGQSIPAPSSSSRRRGWLNPPVDVNTSDNTNIIYWVKGTTLVNGGLSDISGALGVTFVSFTTTSNENPTGRHCFQRGRVSVVHRFF